MPDRARRRQLRPIPPLLMMARARGSARLMLAGVRERSGKAWGFKSGKLLKTMHILQFGF
jgi:hypothetical protein